MTDTAAATQTEEDELPPCVCGHAASHHVGLPGFFACAICGGGPRHIYQPAAPAERGQ